MQEMQWILVFMISLAGFVIVWKRMKLYIAKRKTLVDCQTKGMQLRMFDESRLPMISCILIFAVACFNIWRNSGNIEGLCLWIVIGQIAISEMINTQLMKKTYFNDKIFIFYHRVFAYDDIKRLSVTKSRILPGDTYMVETKSNQMFNVTPRFFRELQARTGLIGV